MVRGPTEGIAALVVELVEIEFVVLFRNGALASPVPNEPKLDPEKPVDARTSTAYITLTRTTVKSNALATTRATEFVMEKPSSDEWRYDRIEIEEAR